MFTKSYNVLNEVEPLIKAYQGTAKMKALRRESDDTDPNYNRNL